VIMSVNPDVIFISPFKRGGYDAMREVGIPLVPHLGYNEIGKHENRHISDLHSSIHHKRKSRRNY